MTKNIVSESLQLGHGMSSDEFDHVVEVFAKLDRRLRSYGDRTIELLLRVKERDTPSQHTTLEAGISGRERLVATSAHTDFDDALIEVRDDLVRQITDAKNMTEPRNNRNLRDRD